MSDKKSYVGITVRDLTTLGNTKKKRELNSAHTADNNSCYTSAAIKA
jgi:hypothetical protein